LCEIKISFGGWEFKATASDALRIWDSDGNLIAEGLSDDNLWGVDWSPDGKHIITSS
jgi:WD40 repeat protein